MGFLHAKLTNEMKIRVKNANKQKMVIVVGAVIVLAAVLDYWRMKYEERNRSEFFA